MIRGGVTGSGIAAAEEAAFPRRRAAAGQSAEARPIPFPLGPALLAAFLVSLMIPGSFALAGFALSPYRVILLVAFVPMALHWIRGRAGPLHAGDVGILLYCLWIWVALFHNHGLGRFHSAGIQFAEMFGGYLIGRTLIRDGEDFARFIRYLFFALLFLLPLALVELLTGFSPLRAVFQTILTVEERRGNVMPRLGFRDRVQGPFSHSIHFGLFCSLAVANVFYHFRGAIVRRMGGLGIAVLLTLTSLSSAPLISAGLQLGMIAWDRVLAFLKLRWVILFGGGAIVLGGFQLLYPGGLLGFVIENLIFIPLTGYARIEVFEFGIQSVYAHPVFGIGYNDWARAFWMEHPTMDNFWLYVAVHYGVPSLLFLWGGIALNIARALINPTLGAVESAQRTGYLTALIGLVIVLGTVALWGAMSTFVLTYIGAGAWFGDRRSRARGQEAADTPVLRPSRVERADPGRAAFSRPEPPLGAATARRTPVAPDRASTDRSLTDRSAAASPPAASATAAPPGRPPECEPPRRGRRPTVEDRIRAARERRQA